ncbi:hypothetical protein BH23PLA1_BH23PLA1_26040 [soil metagenome]
MSNDLTIRRAESPEDYQSCQDAQRRAWSLSDESYIVPIATLVGANRHGGLVLGAFRPDGMAVGVSFGFLGRIGTRLGLYSQLTGMVPEYQGKGLGRRLKQAQFDWAVEQGLEVVGWAFDPLQAGNARFNLDTLGATCGQYIDNMYGPRNDPLNSGVPTDRLIAEWDPHPQPRPHLPDDPIPILPQLAGWTEPEGPLVLLEIPADIQRLRWEDPAAAEQWRSQVRHGLTTAFAQGYRAVGTIREDVEGRQRCYYLLHRLSETTDAWPYRL